MKPEHLSIEWFDRGRWPQCAPDPRFPKGKDCDLTIEDAVASCKIDLPYPAKRCGVYMVTCGRCGLRVGITTAGRPDDPRSAKLPCRTAP